MGIVRSKSEEKASATSLGKVLTLEFVALRVALSLVYDGGGVSELMKYTWQMQVVSEGEGV